MKKMIFILMFGGLVNLQNVLQNQLFAQGTTSDAAFDVDAAKNIITTLFLNERWTNTLSNLQSVNLPIGMQRTVRGVEYILAVTKLEFHPMGTRMNLLLSITTPYRNDELNRLYFYVENVSWSEKGGFSDENVRLALLDDFHIPFGKNMEILLKKAINDEGTFAEIDCHGLKFLSLDASLIFDNSLVIPADCDSTPCSKLTADFSMNIETWSDLIVNINLPDFQVPTLKGWTFQAENVVFDFSENRNSALAKFPQNYVQTYFPNDENIWRGVFIESLKVTLPEYFEGRGRFAFQAQSLIIDDVGVTGMLSAQNVIPQGLAHVGGWGLSMDTLGLDFFANRLKSGYLGGLIHLPVMDSGLRYFGKIFENNRFLMQVNLSDTVQFDCWKTTSVKLNKESFVKMELVEKRFLAQAFLHGAMSFDFSSKSTDSSSLLHVPNIEFQNLVLQNHKPYFSVGQLSYDGSIGFSGFPAQIDEIEVQTDDENALNLRGVASVGLTSANDGAFRGETGFTLHSHLEKTDQRHKWVYEKFSIEKVSINADNHAFSLNGDLVIFENDSLYGQGFSGNVELKIKQPTITVKTAATFGKTSNFRYWFADGLVNFGKTGIPIFAGLSLNGFAGGAYQRMKPTVKSKSQIGVSSSGIQYVPNDSIKLGIQASVAICAQSNPSVFNGEAGLELAFNASGGLNFIQFKGVAKAAQELSGGYMEKLKKNVELLGSMDKNMQEKLRKETEKDAAVTACMTLNYDFNNNVFRGLFDANLSAPLLSGKGQAELYLASGKWYFHVGHPDRRCYVKIGVGNISISTGMYLMAGHDIPAMPRPPAEIRHLISGSDFSKLENSRDVFAVNLGRGFAFGSDFAMNTGDLRFLVFFAQFQARLGFDFALKDYGDFSCAQSSSPIGLNGWYGAGQAYAYLAGKIGIDVKIFGRRKQFTILDAQVGTLLQAQLPNPAWFAGNLAANYNILNGLIKGHCNFKFELGQKCELPQLSEMNNLAVITDLKPSENETDVNVYALPQAAFSLPVKEFRTNEKENYKIQMESFTLKHGNASLTGDLEWNDDFTSVIFSPHEILPHQTNLKASVTLGFYEKINNEWKPLRDDKNQIQKETLSQAFTTGERPKTLPVSEVLYSYPVIDQQNFYAQEFVTGYIQLNHNHGFLFEDENYVYKIRFMSTKGIEFSEPLTYNTAQKRIQWAMPKLNTQTDYTLKIVGEPRNVDENFSNVSENYNTENLDDEGNTTETRENIISETATDDQSIEIFSYAFRSSQYATFAEAVQSLGPLNTKLQSTLAQEADEQYYSISDANYLFAYCSKTADFDEAELYGTRYTQGKTLIKAEAILDAQNIYFADHIHPLIYSPYNFNGLVQLPRNAGQSLLPTWAMMPLDLSANSKIFPWTYDVPLVYKSDLQKIQVQLADQHTRGKNISQYASVLSKSLPLPVYGTYRFTLQYRLPCGTLGTSHTSFFNYTK